MRYRMCKAGTPLVLTASGPFVSVAWKEHTRVVSTSRRLEEYPK